MNLRETEFYKNLDFYKACYFEPTEDTTEEEISALWQFLVDNRLCGVIGRLALITAQEMIDEGRIEAPEPVMIEPLITM